MKISPQAQIQKIFNQFNDLIVSLQKAIKKIERIRAKNEKRMAYLRGKNYSLDGSKHQAEVMINGLNRLLYGDDDAQTQESIQSE